VPSPPTVQAVRVRLDYLNSDGFTAGNRFFITYSGSAPTAANCVTFAGDIGTDWAAHMAAQITTDWSLVEVDVQDLASSAGAFGTSTTVHNATRSTPAMPTQCAVNVELQIARRYRGGKPRIYFPTPDTGAQFNAAEFSGAFKTQEDTAVAAFFAAVEGHSIGSMGTLAHANVSFYHGHDTQQPPAGRWRGPGYKYPPLYRTTALVDPVVGYDTKIVIGSQRRRRTATTP
jgi:hypothetical protein